MNKTCSKCGESKPNDAFHNNSTNKDHLFSWCKACSNKKGRERYHAAKDTAAYRTLHYKHVTNYVNKHPERQRARILAKRAGLRKDNCEHCGVSGRLHMHHDDYSKPLEVITLCVPCHEAVHHGVIL